MGEIAEMMLDGFMDEETGEIIDGTSPGYPRRMSEMKPSDYNRNSKVGLPFHSRRGARDSFCPVCKKAFRGAAGLAQHQAAKHAP